MAKQGKTGQTTVGELRKVLTTMGDDAWRPHDTLEDDAPLPTFPTGGDISRVEHANNAPKIDLNAILSIAPANPNILARRKELGILTNNNPIAPSNTHREEV